MPIPFACPNCRLETLVDDEFAGQSGPCAGCGKEITVPFVPPSQPLGPDEVVVGIARPGGRKSAVTIGLVVAGAVVAGGVAVTVLMALLFPAFHAARATADKHRCSTNLRRIGQALRLYEQKHGTLPPAFVADERGQPMHSWRVLILPYLDEASLFSQYDFRQPWDSPDNLRLAQKMPPVFACPSDATARALYETNYMVIVGPATLFPGRQAVASSQVGDEPRSTLAVVETPANGTTWTQPVDLSVDSMQYIINGTFGREIGGQHANGALALMADGSVRFLNDLLPADYVAGMTTADGNEPIPFELLESRDGW